MPPRTYLVAMLACAVCFSPPVAVATNYFVSASGSNGNAGTFAAPWKDIQYAVDQASPGDAVYVRDGTYNEAVQITASGTPAARITVAAEAGHAPVIDGTGLTGGISHSGVTAMGGFVIIGQSHITVRGFEIRNFQGTGGNFPAGIWVRGGCKGITIEKNTVHAIAAQNNEGAHGIACYGTNVIPMEDLLIDGNVVSECALMWSEALVLNGNVRGFIVRDNTVHDVDNIAYDFIGYEGECGACASDTAGADDVDRVRQGIVHDNVAYNVDTLTNPVYNGERSAGGFYVDGGRDIVFERNESRAANLGFELASEHNGRKTESITVRNNVIHHCHIAGIATGGYKGGTDSNNGNPGGKGYAENCTVINNSLYKNSQDPASWAEAEILLQNRNVNNVYKNNILFGAGGDKTIAVDGNVGNTGNVFDNNIHYATDGAGNPVAISTDAMGAASITADPRYGDVASNDFSLLSESPAIDSGASAGLALGDFDFAGHGRVFNGVVDRGAYEFGSGGAGFVSWIAAFPVGSQDGAEEDFDRDGVSNLWEFGFSDTPPFTALDPSVPDGFQILGNATFVGGVLSLSIVEPNHFPPGVSIRIQGSDDLTFWTDLMGAGVDYTRSSSDNGDGTSTVSYALTSGGGGSGKRFMRAVMEALE